ncbi:hypothetical protein EPA93_47250 [Ktedonosporobacter rubrisoli]|uniref:Uncharacterized protein n=1 Tax=Ktedonosporobacter rubrisoli TaxID=2509675 RepID=A0A4P6K4J7_KTERU|nr:hypothetical protein [Ktedonosporobacter rubrisoli]QBD83159.1 hypothetical protein EPA93_47250 [Ktedonosporobacter rubrisoli]
MNNKAVGWLIMIEQLRNAYNANRWTRIAAYAALPISGGVLYWLAGGFPPWAWRFLFQVLPQLPRFWAVQGPRILFPLLGLVLLSTALVILWGQ